MSIWASIPGDDPVIFDVDGEPDDSGWMDVAESVLGDGLTRIIVRGVDGEGVIVLDAAGLMELHRRIMMVRGHRER